MDPAPASRPASRGAALGLAGIVAAAALLRLVHLGAGLPEVVDVDAFKLVSPARAIAAGETPPRDYQYPELYPRLVALALRLVGANDEAAAQLAARWVSALAGIALVPLVFLLARRLAGDRAALLAAALVAVSPAAVTASRTAATDALLTLAMTAGLLAAASPALADGRRGLGLAAFGGLALGAAIGSKWTGLVLAPVLAAPFLLLAARRRWRPALAGGAIVASVAGLVVVASTPAVVTHGGVYLARFRHDLGIVHHGQIGRVQAGWLDYLLGDTPTWEQPWLGTSLLADAGPLVLLAVLAGVALGLAGRFALAGVLYGLFVAGYGATIVGPGRMLAMRFLLPILPPLFALAAASAAAATARLGRRGAAVAAVALVAVPLARGATSGVFVRGEPTTLEVARSFLAERVGPGEGVFLAPLFLAPLAAGLERPLGLPGVAPRQYRVPGDPAHNGELRPIYTAALVDELDAQGARWVVSAAPFDAAFSPTAGNRRWFPRSVAEYAAWRDRLAERAELALVVDALPAAPRRGPAIEIWRLRSEETPRRRTPTEAQPR